MLYCVAMDGALDIITALLAKSILVQKPAFTPVAEGVKGPMARSFASIVPRAVRKPARRLGMGEN